ncbi:hypothetical protein [Rhizobium leguminosarum]
MRHETSAKIIDVLLQLGLAETIPASRTCENTGERDANPSS